MFILTSTIRKYQVIENYNLGHRRNILHWYTMVKYQELQQQSIYYLTNTGDEKIQI